LIQALACVMRDNCRVSDVACRYGGDEFVIILPDTDIAQTQRMARRLSRRISSDRGLHAIAEAPLARSVGAAARGPGETIRAETLVERADAALYSSKKSGQGRFMMYSDAA
jgi:diguanylate cyclase (GGDEF)-like protein